MKTVLLKNGMKQIGNALLLAVTLGFAGQTTSFAMSDLVILQVKPEWPATSEPGNAVLYTVTATREGQGVLDVALSASDFPAGATVSITPEVLRFTGRVPEVLTATVKVDCAQLTTVDDYPFVITGSPRRETCSVTNALSIQAAAISATEGPVLALDGLSDGGIKLRGIGRSGQKYTIEETDSITNPAWSSVGGAIADGNGRFSFLTTSKGGKTMRFFRTVSASEF